LEDFKLLAGPDGLKINIDKVWGFPKKTSFAGGYDTESTIEIWCGGYRVKGILYISTGEIFNFYEQLKSAYKFLSGSASLSTYEREFEMKLSFCERGRFEVNGRYQEKLNIATELKFVMAADQTYIMQTLEDLQRIYKKYGDRFGKISL
jgi:hypothetical protein